MVATKDFKPGDLILVSKPLGILYGQKGCPPSNEELVSSMLSQPRDPAANAWLHLLSSRGDRSTVEVDDQTLNSLMQLLQYTRSQLETSSGFSESTQSQLSWVIDSNKSGGGLEDDSLAGNGSSSSSVQDLLQESAGKGTTLERPSLLQAIMFNSYSEDSEDAALAELRV
jgi:hypothetical protein